MSLKYLAGFKHDKQKVSLLVTQYSHLIVTVSNYYPTSYISYSRKYYLSDYQSALLRFEDDKELVGKLKTLRSLL